MRVSGPLSAACALGLVPRGSRARSRSTRHPRPPGAARRGAARSRRSSRRRTWRRSRASPSRAWPWSSTATSGTTSRSPRVTTVKAGEPLTPRSRGARSTSSSRRAASRAAACRRPRRTAGVAGRRARRAAQARRAPAARPARRALDHDELLREADLAEGGEIVGADIDERPRRASSAYCALHGYPAAHATVADARDRRPGAHARARRRRAGRAARSSTTATSTSSAREREQVLPRHSRVRRATPATAPTSRRSTRRTSRLEQALHASGWYRAARVARPGLGRRGRSRRSACVLRVRIDAGPLQVPQLRGQRALRRATP